MTMEEKKLNKEQLEAVRYGKGPLLIIAGAGTGKTTVISERIKYLITAGLAKPSEILALTFTDKTAREMEERVDVAMPLGYTQMWISTFHSFGDRVLRDESIHIGLNPRYKLMTKAEEVMFLRKNLFQLELKYFLPLGNPNKFLDGLIQHFSRLKDEDVLPEEYLKWAKELKTEDKEEKDKFLELARAYEIFEKIKIKEGVMDFGDLITNALKLFRERSNILKEYQEKFKYILVDEFQDTNYAQNELALLLAGERKNITVCADDDQAIYRWRGAAVSNVIQFRKRIPETKIVVLTKNYRSTQEILDCAYKLIQNNNPDRLEVKEKIDKKLVAVRTFKQGATEVKFIHTDRVENEAEAVGREIKSLMVKDKSLNFKDFAILVRANNHADAFVRALIRQGIPYQFLGPGMLFRQPEIKDLIAYLEVLYNFEDSIAMYRVLSMEFFDLSGRDLAAVTNFARRNNLSLFETCEQITGVKEAVREKVLIADKTKETLTSLVKMVYRHLELVKKETAGQILYYFLQDIGLLKQLTEYHTMAEERKINNIAKLFDKLRTYEVEHEDASVFAVVDWIKLSLELGESPQAADIDWTENDAVNLLTIHSSKGLEFPTVFLVNLVSQRFPTNERREPIPIPSELIKEILPEGDYHLEEERRLCYVGMTRAKARLYLTAADYYGEGKREKRISPFVTEVLGEEAVSRQSSVVNNQLSILDYRPSAATTVPEMREPIDYLSYSQIETFRICPLQYKYQYLLRIPTPPSAAATFGEVIHESMKDFYQRAMAGQKPTKEALLKILEENWTSVGYSSKAQEARMKREGQKILKEYFGKAYDPKRLPKALEQKFSVKVSANLKVGGKIDRIDETEKGVEIVDYKTGSPSTKREAENDLQLTVYALVAAEGVLEYMGILAKTPKPEAIKVSFYFFDNQEKISSVRTKDHLEQAKKELVKIAQEISQSDFSPAPSRMCDFCDYKLLCEAWK